MKKIKLYFIASAISIASFAQQKGNTNTHIIKQGETIGVLAKQYDVPTNEILQANGLTDKTILRIGQLIVIPKKTHTTAAKPTTVSVVVDKNQHLIESGESLSKIAKKYHITEQELRDWNNLPNDNIRAGNYLVINNPAKTVVKKVVKEEKKEPEIVKKETPKKVEKIVEKPIEKVVVAVKEVPKKVAEKPIEKVEEIVKEVPKKEVKEVVVRPIETKKENTTEGFFDKQYEVSNNSVEGACGVFKTITGWHDKKYYVLLNNAENGSVVKVIANNKFVYAKVLGPLPDIKGDKSMIMRISTAAAAALGVAENKFSAKIEF
jgi:LysM repeat protein